MATVARGLHNVFPNRRRISWYLTCLGLVLILYAPVLKVLFAQMWSNPDYSHGFLVPLFSAYVLWLQRQRWMNTEIAPSNFGLMVILGAIGLLFISSLAAELFTSRFSLLILLAGMILFLAGWNMLRAVSFPLTYLIMMIPIPVVIYNQITFPLQLIASRWATFGLELARVPVLREGNVIILPHYSLEVVEACSGIRSLMTLLSLAIAYGYLVERRHWVRPILVILMIPSAVIGNAIRIMGVGLVEYRFGPAVAEGFFHGFSSWIVFLAALILMFFCHWVLRLIDRKELADT